MTNFYYRCKFTLGSAMKMAKSFTLSSGLTVSGGNILWKLTGK